MTIASAIAALAPSIWLPLDETSGTVANNAGSRTDDGVYSGSFDQGLTGPEVGTFATRLFTGGQVQLGPMDLTTFVDQSIGLWVSTDASGAINTTFPLVSIGDPANRLTRGPMLAENHTVAGQPRWAMMHHGTVMATNGVVAPLLFWHWVVFTMTTGTNGAKLYLDGVLAAQSTLTGVLTNTITDPLLIRCDEPVVVAHVCWFGGVLSQTQIQTVASQLAPWPYTVPINSPPPEAPPPSGGLTPDQAATLARIDTNTDSTSALQTGVNTLLSNWAGYTGVTLPSLQDALNHISGQVTGVQNTLNGWVTGLWVDVQNAIQNVLENVQVHIPGPAGDVIDAIGHIFSPTSRDQFGSYNPYGGEHCDRIDYDMSRRTYFGVAVTITTRPVIYYAGTPDQDWTVPDLAVVTFKIYDEIIGRYPVHNTSWSINPLPGVFPLRVADIGVPICPAGYHVIVDWGTGVCGNFELQYSPAVGPPGAPHFP